MNLAAIINQYLRTKLFGVSGRQVEVDTSNQLLTHDAAVTTALDTIHTRQADGTQKTQVTSLPSLPAGANALGSVTVSNLPADQGVHIATGPGTSALNPLYTEPQVNLTLPAAVAIADGPNLDAFSRLRVSLPITLFSSIQRYDSQPLVWDNAVTGAGAVSFNAGMVSTSLSVGTASGDSVIRQTRRYIPYYPGKSNLVLITGVFGTPKANCRQRVGYFDAANGIFFEVNGTALSVNVRSSTSGSVVDNKILQANWNVDRLDGTGPSGITLDVTKSQILVIDFQWLGMGRVRIGFDIDGAIVYVHEFYHANLIVGPYMQTGKLPIRHELVNTGTTSGGTTMLQTCCTVISEGMPAEFGLVRNIDTGVTYTTVTKNVTAPVLSMRLGSGFNRATLHPLDASVTSDSSAAIFVVKLILNGTLTGASWVAAPDGYAEYDRTATAITGGTQIHSYPARGGDAFVDYMRLESDLFEINSNIAGTSDVLSVVVTSIDGNHNYLAAMTYKESL